jgi:hypothetical protein
VPGYHDIVKQPMDLTTLRANVLRRRYLEVDDFLADLDLIHDNCKRYNGAASVLTETALKLVKEVRSALIRVQRSFTNHAVGALTQLQQVQHTMAQMRVPFNAAMARARARAAGEEEPSSHDLGGGDGGAGDRTDGGAGGSGGAGEGSEGAGLAPAAAPAANLFD